MGDLEHPYQHPYALAFGRSARLLRKDGAQHVVQDRIAGTTYRNRLGGQILGHVTRSHTFFERRGRDGPGVQAICAARWASTGPIWSAGLNWTKLTPSSVQPV
jgi:hypothetical protein